MYEIQDVSDLDQNMEMESNSNDQSNRRIRSILGTVPALKFI